MSTSPTLVPRNGRQFMVLGICRISTEHQDQRSLGDQEALLRRWLDDHIGPLYDLDVIASRDSGEAIDRAEYFSAIERVESRQLDMVVMEDLGRFARRIHAQMFCEICEDAETRLIAINDSIDTVEESWRLNSAFASIRHEMYNRDTARRIRRSLRHRFEQGGMLLCTIYGYDKRAGAKSDNDVVKLPEAEPIYDEWFRRLEDGATYAEIADWLNRQGVKPGKYSRTGKWDASMVSRITRNPILKGLRLYSRTVRKRINKTGRRRAVKADANELLHREVPHLAFIAPFRYDRVLRLVTDRNKKYSRVDENGLDPRRNVPKKQTVWPGQHVRCGICGRMCYFGGHGQTTHLICSGAGKYQCWNGITFDGPLAARKIMTAVYERIELLPDFDPAFRAMVAEEAQRQGEANGVQQTRITRDITKVEREIGNIVAAIRSGMVSRALQDDMLRLEAEQQRLLSERDALDVSNGEIPALPPIAELKQRAREALANEPIDSPALGRVMKRLLPDIYVFPVRILCGGLIYLRAKVSMNLSSWIGDSRLRAAAENSLRLTFWVDLFDGSRPVAYRERVMEMLATGMKQREVAAALGIDQCAVQRCSSLDIEIRRRGIDVPYVAVLEAPEDYGKLRRHRHARYQFEPLAGFPAAAE